MTLYKYTGIIVGIIILPSCQEELVYNPFESSEQGMPRYLAKAAEVTYTNSGSIQNETLNELFSNPNYNNEGKLLNAYINFTGREANNTYMYEQNKIRVYSRTKDNKSYISEYTIDNGLIIDCVESSDSDNEIYYSFNYNSDKLLSTINVNKGDFHSIITLNWHKGNIMLVKVRYDEGYSSIYSYEYACNKEYKPIFPFFWISCFEIGSVYGVDEILSCQGYFGKSIPNDLINKEYYNGNLSREFEYKLDSEGNIIEVSDMNSNRNTIIRKYTLEWR